MNANSTFTFVSRRHLLVAGSLGLLGNAAWAQSEAWPTRPVKLVVNFPPGSSPDVLARALLQPLQQAFGQPFVAENRAGGSGMIGAEAVTRSNDGHTLLVTSGSTITTNPHIFDKMPFDAARDLVPVAALARITLFLVARPELQVNTVADLVRLHRERPGRLSYGSPGNATGPHLAGEMFKSQAKVFAVHVPYRGSSPALQDLLAGQVDYLFDPGIALPHVRAGKLKLLAVATPRRSSVFPDVPTLDEAGLKGFDAGTTHGVYAPAGTRPDVVTRLNAEINKALALPSVRSQVQSIGAEPTPLTPAQFVAQMEADSRRYAAIIKERGIRGD
jgi:tripartite-type tricarboxylate transporter receptor subunit TctC